MKLISEKDRQRIEDHLKLCLARLLAADGLSPLSRCLSKYVLGRGKRIRPQLCVWVFQQAADLPIDDAVLDVACAWEIFHAFLLAHDDIIDQAETRRDTLSLHRQLQSLDHDSRKFGIDLAIVAGDLLFGGAMRLLADAPIEPVAKVELMQLFARIACTTGFGQAVDICQSQAPLASVREQTLLNEYYSKTAAYTFEGPMLSGAILAGLDVSAQQPLATFARAVGQAYQLRNDLEDLSRPAREGCDLLEGKRTIPMMRARAAMTVGERDDFDQRLNRLPHMLGDRIGEAEALRQRVCDTGIEGETNRLIAQLLASANHATGDVSVRRLGDGMGSLLDGLSAKYFATVGD